MKETYLDVLADVCKNYTVALVSDLHNIRNPELTDSLKKQMPDYIAVNGDLLYAVNPYHSIYEHVPESGQHLRNAPNAIEFLTDAVKIAPVLFSTGNHELYLDEEDRALLLEIGVNYLDDGYCRFGELVFGGLSSPYKIFAGAGIVHKRVEHKRRWKMVFENVNTTWLDEFEGQEGYKILLCHHPEFYEPFLKNRKGIDIVLAGHAHGGQIRLFDRGLFAYGQGWFPKYTKGLYDGKMIVSSGLANTSKIPRIGNPPELVYVELSP